MKVKPLKIKIKYPTPTAAERLYAKHQEIRKKSGLPDPSEYKKKLDAMKSEETVQEQLYKKGRFVSGPGKKPFKSFVQAAPQNEAKDPHEYDYEGEMALNQLDTIMRHVEYLKDMIKPDTNLPEWVQSKITLAADYIQTSCDYLTSEMDEEVKLSEASKFAKMFDKAAKRREMNKLPKQPKGEYERKVDQYLKKKYNKEEVELQEGRASQRHPLEGHEYHKKSNEALVHIAKDAHAAAEAMKGHNTQAENKYRDQANDSATVRYFRQKHGMPDWYKKKYGHVKEEVELDENDLSKFSKYTTKPTKTEPKIVRKTNPAGRTSDHVEWEVHGNVSTQKRSFKSKKEAQEYYDTVKEEVGLSEGENKQMKDDDPCWKGYQMVGKKIKNGREVPNCVPVKEGTEDSVEMQTTKMSRKAQIVRDAAKGKKDKQNAKDEASDKFQSEPELSSAINKT